MTPFLLLLDGLNILRRCYEANPAADSPEKADAACSAALRSMERAIRERAPSHLLVVFDSGEKNWRHRLYPDYKVKRKPMPAPLAAVYGTWQQVLAARWPIMVAQDEEADDTLLRVGLMARRDGFVVEVRSTDKDMGVLAAYGIAVHAHFTDEFHDAAWCQKKFGVSPLQLTDYLALMGDATDGIPGVARVGHKTASSLLQTYGTLEAILAAAQAGKIPGKVGETLVEQQEAARISQQLATLRTDPYGPDVICWDELVYG